MSLRRYDSYRDSGIEWVDVLPSHWGSIRLKWSARRYAGGTPDKTRIDYWTDGTIPWLNSGAVNQTLITEPSAHITEEAFANSSARWVPSNALVMALAGQGKTKGMVAQLAIPATCNQSMAAIVPGPEVVARYLFWWLTDNYQNIRNMAGGDLRDGLNLELLGNIPCPHPPISEQTAIAAFLDRETAKIDALANEQRRLIELLKEKQRTLISHAVTKGLDPNVPMKDSGVEWLGAVPEHWRIIKLAKLTSGIGDGLHGTPEYVDESDCYFINGNNLVDDRIEITDSTRCVSPEVSEKYAVPLNDRSVLISINGTIGNLARYRGENVTLGKSAAYINCGCYLDPAFLIKFLSATPVKAYFELSVTGTTISNLSLESLRNLPVALPPIDEQIAIVGELQAANRPQDALVDASWKTFALLSERRSALISAAVTGKIALREVVDCDRPALEVVAA